MDTVRVYLCDRTFDLKMRVKNYLYRQSCLTHFVAEIHHVLQRYVAVYIIRSIVVRAHSRTVEAATAIKLAGNVTTERISLEFREEIADFSKRNFGITLFGNIKHSRMIIYRKYKSYKNNV